MNPRLGAGWTNSKAAELLRGGMAVELKPTPADADLLAKVLLEKLDALGDDKLRTIAMSKLEGYTAAEIAVKLNHGTSGSSTSSPPSAGRGVKLRTDDATPFRSPGIKPEGATSGDCFTRVPGTSPGSGWSTRSLRGPRGVVIQ